MRFGAIHTSQQMRTFFVCVGIFALGQFHRASGGVYTPILLERYMISATAISALVSSMFLASVILQIPMGTVLDKRGPSLTVLISLVAVTLGTWLFCLAFNYYAILASRIMIGAGLAALGSSTYVIISQNFRSEDFGYVNGLVMTLGGIGGLVGTYPLSVALEHLTWPLVFGVTALASALFTPIAFLIVRKGEVSEETSGTTANEANVGYLELIRSKVFLKILVLGALSYAPATTITGLWGGAYLREVGALTQGQAGAALSVLFLAIISSSYLFGILDRLSKSKRRLISSTSTLCGSSLILLAVIDKPSPAISVGLLFIAIFFQQFSSPLAAYMRQMVPGRSLGRASSILLLTAVAAIPAMQLGFGAILDVASAYGVSREIQYRAAFALVGLLVLFCAWIFTTSANQYGVSSR